MQRHWRKLSFLALCLSPACAQTVAHNGTSMVFDGVERPFALVVNSSTVTVNGGWHALDPLPGYTQAHPGSYIVFVQGGELHRLNTPERVADAEKLYAPMLSLEARQRALAAEQRPLAEQQRALAAEQRAAVNPAEQGRIGALQGKLGAQQGAIGERQGEIGRKQGEVGRAFYDRVQAMLEVCLTDGSCPRVPAAALLSGRNADSLRE